MADEEDYMSMVIEEPKQKETFTQKKLRQQREVCPVQTSYSYSYSYNHLWDIQLIEEKRQKPKPKSHPKPNVGHKKQPVAMPH